jgi:DNA helicase-2/ATP-dependent DNA helicase PcrA
LLVVAGAGSGKTKVLAHRVAHLILNGRDPQRLLLLRTSQGQHPLRLSVF